MHDITNPTARRDETEKLAQVIFLVNDKEMQMFREGLHYEAARPRRTSQRQFFEDPPLPLQSPSAGKGKQAKWVSLDNACRSVDR